MARTVAAVPRLPRLLLLLGGSLFVVTGAVGVGAGALLPDRLQALLPPVVVDTAAIGGATVALGLVALAAGLVQVGIGIRLSHGGWAVAAAAVVLAVLGALLVATSVVLLTEVAAGAPSWLLAPGLALLVVATVYAIGAWRLTERATREAGRRPG